MATSISLSATVAPLPSGTQTLAALWSIATPIGQVTPLTLGSGDNTITIPAGTKFILITPPPANAVALTLKGVGGDTGIGLDPAAPFVYCPKSGQANFIINAAGATANPTTFNFL